MTRSEKIELLEYEEKYIRDWEFDPMLQEYCYLQENGDTEALVRIDEEMAACHFKIERIQKKIRLIREGAEKRADYKRLQRQCDIMNAYNSGYECGALVETEYEDYGPYDFVETGWTEDSRFYVKMYESKTVKKKFDLGYLSTVAARNPNCRYCSSAATQEEVAGTEWRKEDIPYYATGGTPIHVLNAIGRGGGPGKWQKMLKHGIGLVLELEAEGGELLIFSPKALKTAFLGYLWIKCGHTTEFSDREVGWELKAAVDLTKYTYKIPREFIEEYDKCGDSKNIHRERAD